VVLPRKQFWSLFEIMREFRAWRFMTLLYELHKMENICTLREVKGQQDEEINERYLEQWVKPFMEKECRALCEEAQLRHTVKRLDGPFKQAMYAYGAPTWRSLQTELKVLREQIDSEMIDHYYAIVDDRKADWIYYLEVDDPKNHWLKIWEKFPAAKYDCKEAVYCYVLERHTACVFHSMRIAEFGLRALARRMKITLPKNRRLEWAEWQQILRELHAKTETIASMKAGPVRDELLEFYRGAIGQFYGFKDEYRNFVMHNRKAYDEHQSASAMSQVKEFMNKLASRINEKGRVVREPKA